MKNAPFVSKEISWLYFNERVLQEAADPSVPLMERMKFIGIFSSNLDEFFRVRVATLHRLVKIRDKATALIGHDPQEILDEVHCLVVRQIARFEALYQQLLDQLSADGVFIRNEKELNDEQKAFVATYFHDVVRPLLVPLMLTSKTALLMKDQPVYLAVRLQRKKSRKLDYALIQVPADRISRFLILPSGPGTTELMLLEDVIRLCLPEIFFYFDYSAYDAYVVKMTRDSELDMDDERIATFPQKVQEGLARRIAGDPVRFVYDRTMPQPFLNYLREVLDIEEDKTCIGGGRYHNFKDFIGFPKLDRPGYYYADGFRPVAHPQIKAGHSILDQIAKRDLLCHFPYHTFEHFIDLLREAAIDPRVTTIRITAYRLAQDSQIVNALVNAAQNGKKVFAVVELQARFDEAANLFWSDRLRENGVRVVHGLPDLKVHAKLCLITRHESGGKAGKGGKGGKKVRYACVGTGNFHEGTARLYTDHLLMTADQRITGEVHKVFELFDNKYRIPMFRHLVVSPFQARNKYRRLIQSEIRAAKAGEVAGIDIKINNFADPEMAELLYRASRAGVAVRIVARSMFSMVPGIKGLSERIEAISIVDRLLEHSRFFIFHNRGTPLYFISSGDWLPRNFDRRVEVAVPLYDKEVQNQLRQYFDVQWSDNCKARLWDEAMSNGYRPRAETELPLRSQVALMAVLQGEPRQDGEKGGQ
ncbi:MAG: polyphosphate kinase 1 [Desulfuromonadaceae bacterium]|nr:polyphosphate kinase 1 [Desulfuromonadaceae bacterium]